MNKIVLVLLTEILLTLLFVFFASNHYDGIVTITCPVDKQVYDISYVKFAAVTYLTGAISTLIIYMLFNISTKNTMNEIKKEREKHSVAAAEKDSLIAALENKVKTLETALNSIIENKDNKDEEK